MSTVAKPSCVLSVIVVVLLASSTGLLVMVLKGDYAHPHHEELTNGSHHHHHHHHHQNVTPEVPQSDQPPNSPDEPWKNFRLPKTVLPIHYDIQLSPDLKTNTFFGSVHIDVNVTTRTRYFLVHVDKELIVKHSSVSNVQQDLDLQLDKKFTNELNEYYVMEAKEEAEAGIYRLYYVFEGRLSRSIFGFFSSRYISSRNEWTMASSKFQPDYARRAFPCFDEPGLKATFNVTLKYDKKYIALSNMPQLETEPIPWTDLYITKFMKSVPMVTYLSCFIVGDFRYKELITSSGKPFRVYSVPDAVNTTEYALQFGSTVLEYFEKYFGIDYPLPKLDMIAVAAHPSGATEHWGLITFKEETLLYDPANSSPAQKQRVAAVIAHELSHMWFGNLVTMEWWDDFWLNEGFASYFEYMGIDKQHPDWDIHSQFLVEDLHPVMLLDSTNTTKTMIQPVTTPGAIYGKFDKISYAKGASIVRMMKFFLGNKSFRKGISTYLSNHQYGSVKTNDLWNELSSACGQQGNRSIPDIMNTWTGQKGFPYVTVKRKGSNSTTFIAQQRRFFRNPAMDNQKEDLTQKNIWSIPLSYISSNRAEGIVWIHEDTEMEFTLPVKDSDWVKFNFYQTGFYLINYDKDEWKKLSDVLLENHKVLSPSDRSNLLFDSYLLAEGGHVGFDVFLTLSLYLRYETHYVPWKTAQDAFQRIYKMLLKDTESSLLLKNHIRYLTWNLHKELGFYSSNDHLENLLRATIIEMACGAGNRHCLESAADMFNRWVNGEIIPVAIRNLVYKFGMAEVGEDKGWDKMWNAYLLEKSKAQQKAYLVALAQVQEPSIIQRYINYSLDQDKIRGEDFYTVVYNLIDNAAARQLTWSYLNTTNWRIIKTYCEYLTYEEELKERLCQENRPEQNHKLNTHHLDLKTWLKSESPAPWYHHRLPSHIIPVHYDLLLYPMLDKDLFNGSVVIEVQLQKPSSYILVHSVDLNVTGVAVTSGDETVVLREVSQYKDHDYLVIETEKTLPIGTYRLHFEFEGPLTLSLEGLYKSSYVDPVGNETRYLAATQFESIHARKAFPCFDEPSFRSTFNVSIIHEPSHFALSNTMVESTTQVENDLLMTRFQKTLPMVTYLLAIVVCDFEYKETTTDNGVRLRTYTAPHHIEKTQYALEVGSRILTYYENYFGVPFPLDKLDMIAIPDFGSNGMENWGLITYSERSLICENTSTVSLKQRVVYIIAHELAHMWFGDLVTMNWWSDLWLNEGFATYIAVRGIELVEPEFDEDDERGVDNLLSAMVNDQSVNSHPIVQTITHVTSAIFDSITYSKGSAVLRMLESFMGEDFRIGVSAYLKKYSFGNAETENLWEALTEVSKQGLNVSKLMRTWTHQKNYPFLSVEINENGSYVIQQHRYFANLESRQMAMQRSTYDFSWQIPVAYRSSNNNETLYMLLNTTKKVDLLLPKSDWIKLNYGVTGYYSVNYDTNTWNKFSEILENNHTFFSPADRLNLLFDAFSMSSAGIQEYGIALNLTRYLRNEEHYSVWEYVYYKLYRLQMYFHNDVENGGLIQEYIRSLSKDLYNKYSWNNTGDYSERKLRKILIHAACSNGNRDCLLTAGRLLREWADGKNLPSELKTLVLMYGLRVHKDSYTWNLLWNRYLEEKDPAEKTELLYALYTVPNEHILERLVEYVKDEQLVRKHYFFTMMRGIARNPYGISLIDNFIFNNWEYLIRNYGVYQAENFARNVFSQYISQRELQRVQEFYASHPKSKDSSKERTMAIEKIKRNIWWTNTHGNNFRDWFRDNVYMPWKSMRLPTHIHPTQYNITLYPNITKGDFEGDVDIELNVSKSTDCVIFHQNDLEISEVQFMSLSDGEIVEIEEEFPYNRNQFYVVRFKSEVRSGRYVLNMKFFRKFAADDRGFGRYQYTDRITKDVRYLLATFSEPIYARKIFPCFDEPAMKAKFQLSIVHDPTLTAVSNMPEETKASLDNGLVKTIFKETYMMSTYLLFASVFDFGYLQADYKGIEVRAYAPLDRLLEAEHGLNMTVQILEKCEKFFGVPYALPKIDSIVIPKYISSRMEHWGAIAYSEENFLLNKTHNTSTRILEVDSEVIHEVVHQWIGNLVTIEWWSDKFLKESLTSFLTYMMLKEYYPAIDEVFVRGMSNMMCIDSTLQSHPIVKKAPTPKEIFDTFDIFYFYEKGSAVLRMLQNILKEDFQRGISTFLKKYSYRIASTKDLWTELSNATLLDVDIAEIMNPWTHQIGFPYVELKRKGEIVTATQQWFVKSENYSAASEIVRRLDYAPFEFIWKIPLVYKNLRTGIEHTIWLNDKNATFQVNATSEDLIKFNPGFVGFYIVNYDTYEWARLGQRLRKNHLDFSVIDRYNLLHDAFALAETEHLSYDVPLRLSRYLVFDSHFLPWNIFKDGILRLMERLRPETTKLLKAYVAELTSKFYDDNVQVILNKTYFKKWKSTDNDCSGGWTDGVLDLDFLFEVVELACRASNEKCLSQMREELQLWMLGKDFTVDLQLVFKLTIPRFGNDTSWEYLYQEITSNDTSRDTKYLIAEGLGLFTERRLVKKTIDVIARDPAIDPDLAQVVFKNLADNPKSLSLLWEYSKSNWNLLMKRLLSDPTEHISQPESFHNGKQVGRTQKDVLSIFCANFKTSEQLHELIQFVESLSNETRIEDCIEKIEDKIKWSEKYEENIATWLTWNVNK